MNSGAKILPLLLLTLVSACANRTFSVSLEGMETDTPLSSSLSLPPTWTPSPTSLPQPTPTPFPTYTPVPPLATVLPTIPDPIQELRDRSGKSLRSPNGQWSANFDSATLHVVNEITGRVWTLPCTLFKECSVITPVKWSADNRTLYFAPEALLGEAPVGIRLYTAAARIDTESGTWEKILEETDRYYDFAVSHDDAYLAYTQPVGSFGDNTSISISVLNLKNDQEAKYSLNGFIAGNIIWSPYTSRFVFQVQDPERGTSILYYDVESEVLKYILKEEKDDFLLSSWGEINLVSLKRSSRLARALSDWVLNPFTNEITPVPTPN